MLRQSFYYFLTHQHSHRHYAPSSPHSYASFSPFRHAPPHSTWPLKMNDFSGALPNSERTNKIALYAILIYRYDATQPIFLSATVDLTSFPFFHRSSLKEHIYFHSRLVCSRTPRGNREVIELESGIGHLHIYTNKENNISVMVLSTKSYPLRIAFGLIDATQKLFQQKCRGMYENVTNDLKEGMLLSNELNELLKKYQNPSEADKLSRVQKDLDEVKDVMLKNIEDLLQRGEKLDDLMKKSQDLSNSSYQFYRYSTSEKRNIPNAKYPRRTTSAASCINDA
ncbi:SNARE protein, putative [Plasmodium ovale wallikeri]|uniref:SNARE protein, putative n=1 Tax=Plasmodium ovale wallikeri TaxID=864142 RepID=A0A1A8ZBX1_PLAOA|nr:SNARE protein, putative [Plasmodium ovale wallikeri]SBT41748.1 SNARE protein, putative [Plasmodium ovale wallikeri]